MTTRRSLLKSGAMLALLPALAVPAIHRARAADRLTFFTPFGFNADFIEVMNAAAAGYFAHEGLDVTIRGAHGTAQTMQALMTGSGQIIRSANIEQMRIVDRQKAPIVCISTLYQSSNFFIISPKAKPIAKAEDLKGKTLGIVSNGGSTEVFVDLILRKVGLSRDDVKREITGNSPGALQFVKQGRVDAFIGTLSVVIPLQRAGEEIVYWSTDRYAPMPCQGYLATRDFLSGNGDVAVRFLRALTRSAEEIVTRPLRPIYERAAKQFEIPGIRDIDTLVAVTETWKDLLLSQGHDNLLRNVPSLWQSGVTALNDAGLMSINDPTVFYTNDLIDRARKA
jgi:ABC-type nitrate/sulfonate/bicarbonate transport system substrate-binding protein